MSEPTKGSAAQMRDELLNCKTLLRSLALQVGEWRNAANNEILLIDAALAAPIRNCDRFDGDIDKLREACARERGLNPEEDFPDVFPDWLLALSTEKEGGAK